MIIQLSKYLFSIVFAFLSIFISCTQVEEESIILTEGVLFLSGERVRLSGRIYSTSGGEVSDHGFEIGTSESFDNPLLIQNGVKSSLGPFIGESSQLVSDKDYYYRAYAVINDVIYYGSIKSFLTLNPTLISFSPQAAHSNNNIKIIGTNFSSKTKVFFGENEAVILNIELESVIEVQVPNIGVDTEVIIKVTDGVSELIFENSFQYIYGTWTPKGYFFNTFRINEPISFSKDSKFVFGLGRNLIDGTLNNSLWEYDIISDAWRDLDFAGTASLGSFFNNGGYFGGGYKDWTVESSVPSFEFWKYDNGVVNYIGEVPFNLYQAASFYYDGNVYVTGGINFDGTNNFSLYLYSEQFDSWKQIDDIPIIVSQNLPHFTFSNFQYFITADGEIWNYNMDNGDWGKIDNAPITIETGGISEVINNKAYIGIFSFDDQVWEYDIINNIWKSKSEIEDGKSRQNAGSYVWNSKVRVVRLNPSGSDSDWIQTWEFDPLAF